MWLNIQIWCFELFLSYWLMILCWWMMSRKNNLIQVQTINNDIETITYSREDLVQICNIVRDDRSLNRLPIKTCYKIRILRLNNIPKIGNNREKDLKDVGI